jgi:hypothetical protein
MSQANGDHTVTIQCVNVQSVNGCLHHDDAGLSCLLKNYLYQQMTKLLQKNSTVITPHCMPYIPKNTALHKTTVLWETWDYHSW